MAIKWIKIEGSEIDNNNIPQDVDLIVTDGKKVMISKYSYGFISEANGGYWEDESPDEIWGLRFENIFDLDNPATHYAMFNFPE